MPTRRGWRARYATVWRVGGQAGIALTAGRTISHGWPPLQTYQRFVETEFNRTRSVLRLSPEPAGGARGDNSGELDDAMRIATYNATGGLPTCWDGWRRPRRTSSACRS